MTPTAWMLAAFAAAAALVPAGVYFTMNFGAGYSVSGYGTAIDAAPGPLLGAGLIPAALVIGAAYRYFRRSRQKAPPAQE